jgi:antitoxin component YwqK of YwqJK toxin-antitoxin module
MHNRPHTRRPEAFALLLCLCALISSCSEQRLQPDDVEYRKDDNGTQFLYQIGADEPFGTGKRAFVEEYYPSTKNDSFWGQQHFEVGFLDGQRDGNFTFWQKNGIKLLTGAYTNGLRDGKFTAYGKTGELVYEKTFKNGELDGNFTMYYPASNNDVFRYKEKLTEEDKEPGELTVKNHLRLKLAFSEGNPVGPYEAYFHPGDQNSSQAELLMETGHFSQAGVLEKEQITFYPQTNSLVVILPDKKRPFPPHKPTPNGFSRAIDEAAKAIKNIPAYRNPDNAPALVYTLDARGEEIVPIWSSHIQKISIRKGNGFLINKTFEPNYESFEKAQKIAEEITESSVEVVGLDKKGQIVDILWSGDRPKDVTALPDRINKHWVKTKRSWDKGYASDALWLLSNGSQISIRENIHQ